MITKDIDMSDLVTLAKHAGMSDEQIAEALTGMLDIVEATVKHRPPVGMLALAMATKVLMAAAKDTAHQSSAPLSPQPTREM